MAKMIAALCVLLYTMGVDSAGPCSDRVGAAGITGAVGAYTPQCTFRGYFQVVQFHPSSGYSWCVNPETGDEIDGSKVSPATGGLAQCGQCLHKLQEFLSTGFAGVGRSRPKCDEQGLFAAMQSSGSTGYSWCVDPFTGEKIKGTDVAPGQGEANCEVARKKRNVMRKGPCPVAFPHIPRPIGQYHPQCNVFGWYKVEQIHGSTGHRWCVHPETGARVEGSDAGPGQDLQCGKCLHELLRFHSHGRVSIPMWKPSCDEQGRFTPLQEIPGKSSWCVKTETGEKIEGTEVPPTSVASCQSDAVEPEQPQPEPEPVPEPQPQPEPESITGAGPCEIAKAQTKPLLGAFIPGCDSQGFYNSVQNHEGYRFCVDTNTGIQLPNSPRLRQGEDGKLPCEN